MEFVDAVETITSPLTFKYPSASVDELKSIDFVSKNLTEEVAKVKEVTEVLPAYFEDASNEVANIIKRGVDADIKIAHDRLQKAFDKVSESVEIQRRLTSQLTALAKKLNDADNSKQAIIQAGAAFAGAFLAVLIGLLFFK